MDEQLLQPPPPPEADFTIPGHNGAAVPVRTLFQEDTPERSLRIVASMDGMGAYMQVLPGPEFHRLEAESIRAYLSVAEVTTGIVDAGIGLLAALQNSPKPSMAFHQLARGTAMRRGEKGSIEFHAQPTSFSPNYDQGDDGAIDYKQLNLIENCFAGQRVATILPPGPGRAGIDVFGHEIPAVPGEPAVARPGPGVIVSPNGRDFTAEVEGRLVFEDGVLTVSPLLEINRDVDYSVGNIDFIGKVLVHGSLLDGFYVNGKAGVEITGEVGAARITSDGDVRIDGGIRGKDVAIITCRDLEARYIDNANVEASGDVTVIKEILHSSVKALGRVTVSAGTIIGGLVCGFRGVEADTLGSDIGAATKVHAGISWTEENRREDIRVAMAENLDRVQSAKVLLDPLFAARDEVRSSLGAEQKSMLTELIGELRDIRESLVELLEERESLDAHNQDGLVNQINVRKTVYQGVEVRFSMVQDTVKSSVKGPISILPDPSHKTLSFAGRREMPGIAGAAAAAAQTMATAEKAGA